MDKGFIHMVEIILVSLVVMISLPVLLYPSGETYEWDKTILLTNGEDFISTSDSLYNGKESFVQDLMEKNKSEIYNQFGDIFGNRSKLINYGIQSIGPIKNEIRVGFNCTTPGCNTTMKNYLRDMLTPTYVNGRFIKFKIVPFSYDKFEMYDIDVIFLNDTEQVNQADSYFDKVKKFVEDGNGMILFMGSKNLATNWNANKDIYSKIFGVDVGNLGNGDLTFNNPDDPTKPNYEIQKYFYGVGAYVDTSLSGKGNLTVWNEEHSIKMNTSCTGVDVDTNITEPGYEETDLGEGDCFTMNFDSKKFNFSVEKIDPTCNYVIFNFLRKPNLFEFDDFLESQKIKPEDGNMDRVVLSEGNGRNAVIVNQSSGRAVWVHDGNGDDIDALVKSSIMWAAEHKWWNVLRTVSGEQTKISYFVSQGNEFFEPYWVEMNMWYVY